MSTRTLPLIAITACMGLAACNSTSSPVVYDAPPEPGQTTFSGPGAGPIEPGQTTWRPEDDGVPEPGQTTFE